MSLNSGIPGANGAVNAMAVDGSGNLAIATSPAAGKSQQLTSPDQVPEGLAKSEWQSNLRGL